VNSRRALSGHQPGEEETTTQAERRGASWKRPPSFFIPHTHTHTHCFALQRAVNIQHVGGQLRLHVHGLALPGTGRRHAGEAEAQEEAADQPSLQPLHAEEGDQGPGAAEAQRFAAGPLPRRGRPERSVHRRPGGRAAPLSPRSHGEPHHRATGRGHALGARRGR